MSTMLMFIFGILPSILLGLLTPVPLLIGLSILLDMPAEGLLLVAWAIAGFAGAVSMFRASRDAWSDNTIPGLLAGIVAAAPLAWIPLTSGRLPDSLPALYVTVGPISVACAMLAKHLLFSSPAAPG